MQVVRLIEWARMVNKICKKLLKTRQQSKWLLPCFTNKTEKDINIFFLVICYNNIR